MENIAIMIAFVIIGIFGVIFVLASVLMEKYFTYKKIDDTEISEALAFLDMIIDHEFAFHISIPKNGSEFDAFVDKFDITVQTISHNVLANLNQGFFDMAEKNYLTRKGVLTYITRGITVKLFAYQKNHTLGK